MDRRRVAMSPGARGRVHRPPGRHGRARHGRAGRRVAGLLLLAAGPVLVLGVLFVLPVTGMIAEGFWVDGRFAPGAVLEVLSRPRVHRVAWFTVWTSGVATLLAVVLGLPAAYALHRLALPGRSAVRAALLVPFVLPTVVVGVAFRQLLGEGGPLGFLGLDGTPVAILCGLVFFNVAVVVRTVGVAWESLDSRPGQAAAALGASPWQVLRTVTLPALRPAIVGAASIVFLFCATAFGIVLTLGGVRYATVETEIYLLTTTIFDLQAAAALSVLQIVVVLVLLAVAARLRATPDPTAQRVVAPARVVRRSDAPVVLATVLVLAAMLLPILTLVLGSLSVGDGWGLDNYRALTTAGDDQALLVPVTTALATSLRTAVDATWMALLVGVTVSVLVTRRSHSAAERRLRSGLDGFFMLPLGVSAVTLGFGFLITLDEPPLDLRDSPLLVPMAQALVALPLVVRTLTPVLGGVDDRQRQAAASLGASAWRTFVTVDLPVAWKPMLAAGGFAFAASLGEFGATSFLARDTSPTLPVVIFRLIGHPGEMNYGMALAASVVLATVTALVMLAVERLRVPGVGAF
ncbi:ABC transporter permease [Nocardioides xinjiangensis]|uniref:ABC transporter permease n=1 Tax=Nocardioides xinjiangensis TaxID=2817376 RepID=UPI0027DC5088|nr:iron ABC transporter permease [Nocardioides sp. SYSU D00778]